MRISASNYRLMPVYTSLKDQLHRSCGNTCSELLTVTDTAYPSFQLVFNEDKGAVSQSVVMNADTDQTASLGMGYSITKHIRDIDGDGNNEYIYIFDGGFFLNTSKGNRYLRFVLDGITYYTEVYWHPGQDKSCKDKWWLEYTNCCDDKNIGLYSVHFKNTLFLGDVFISRDGEIENTVTRQDGFGVETIVSSTIKPKHSFEIMGASWLLDSLSYLKLYDNITLRRGEGGEEWKIRDIEVTAIGEPGECYFPIRIGFTKEIIEHTKCCESVFEEAPLPGNCAGMAAVLSPGYTVCQGSEVDIEADVYGGSGPHIFVWQNGFIGKTLTVTVEDTTVYTVVVIDAFGCAKVASIQINAVECIGDLVVEITGDTEGCSGASKTLTASPSGGSGTYTYLWSTGATTASINVAPGSTTTYSVQVTDTVTGDIAIEHHTITIPPANQVIIWQNNGSLCYMASLNVAPCDNVVFEWQVETNEPNVFEAAPGENNGPAYTGVSGKKYRLKQTCDGCDLYSNVLTANCASLCTAIINDITFDGENGLMIDYEIELGTTPVGNMYIAIYETNSPNLSDCSLSDNWELVGNWLLFSLNTPVNFPEYEPLGEDFCIYVIITVNGGECSASMYKNLSVSE